MDAETVEKILNSLMITLSVTEEEDVTILTEILNDAIDEVIRARRYPSEMSAEEIASDMDNYIVNVKRLAKYDFNQVGVEYETQHNENGISRIYDDRRKCFEGIKPYSILA